MFETAAVTVGEQVDARKNKIEADGAWELLRTARQVLVARGKGFLTFDPQTDSREAILKACLGRSGTLRAPALRIGDRLLIGYSDQLYQEFTAA